MAEQHDEWAEGRRYLGLEVLKQSGLSLIERTANDHEHEAENPAALTA